MLRIPGREPFPQPYFPGHVSCPQVFPRSLPTTLRSPRGTPYSYPQRTGCLYYNDKGYD